MAAIDLWPDSLTESETATLAVDTHSQATGTFPSAVVVAPANSIVMGGFTEHVGGSVLTLNHAEHICVAISPREDDAVTVSFHSLDSSGNWHEDMSSCQLITDPDSAEETPAAATSWAESARVLIMELSNHQVLPRTPHGYSVTAFSTIPTAIELGVTGAFFSGLALALADLSDPRDEAPLRLKLAGLAHRAAERALQRPFTAARYHAVLRQAEPGLGIVNFADGSVTATGSPFGEFPAVVIGSSMGTDLQAMAELERRYRFVHHALAAFNVDTLAQLPDAPTRIADWVATTISVSGHGDLPSARDAHEWLTYLAEDTVRTTEFITHLRARHFVEAFDLFKDFPTDGYTNSGAFAEPVASAHAVWDVLSRAGAVATRQLHLGRTDTTLGLFHPATIGELAGTSTDIDLIGVRVRPGDRAHHIDPLTL